MNLSGFIATEACPARHQEKVWGKEWAISTPIDAQNMNLEN
jgi:hypothetical protein